jgi:hypothetical protein
MERHRKLFQLTAFILLGAAGLGLGFIFPAFADAPGSGPQAIIRETAFDFGTVMEDQALTHTFVIQNAGGARLEILEVDPDCNCTVPKYDRTIAPGGQGEITLTIKPFTVRRQFKKSTAVRFNDPAQPEVKLILTGVAVPAVEIQPSHIVNLRGVAQHNLQGQVRFISHLSKPWEITDYRTNIPDKIELSLKAVEPGKVYVLEIRNKQQEAGRYAGMVELVTNIKERPRLLVRVFGDIQPSAGGAP